MHYALTFSLFVLWNKAFTMPYFPWKGNNLIERCRKDFFWLDQEMSNSPFPFVLWLTHWIFSKKMGIAHKSREDFHGLLATEWGHSSSKLIRWLYFLTSFNWFERNKTKIWGTWYPTYQNHEKHHILWRVLWGSLSVEIVAISPSGR